MCICLCICSYSERKKMDEIANGKKTSLSSFVVTKGFDNDFNIKTTESITL